MFSMYEIWLFFCCFIMPIFIDSETSLVYRIVTNVDTSRIQKYVLIPVVYGRLGFFISLKD